MCEVFSLPGGYALLTARKAAETGVQDARHCEHAFNRVPVEKRKVRREKIVKGKRKP